MIACGGGYNIYCFYFVNVDVAVAACQRSFQAKYLISLIYYQLPYSHCLLSVVYECRRATPRSGWHTIIPGEVHTAEAVWLIPALPPSTALDVQSTISYIPAG